MRRCSVFSCVSVLCIVLGMGQYCSALAIPSPVWWFERSRLLQISIISCCWLCQSPRQSTHGQCCCTPAPMPPSRFEDFDHLLQAHPAPRSCSYDVMMSLQYHDRCCSLRCWFKFKLPPSRLSLGGCCCFSLSFPSSSFCSPCAPSHTTFALAFRRVL